MADSVNKVMLIGRAGKEPEVRFSQNGVATAKFSLATSKKWKNDKGENFEETTWHRITIFGKRAEGVSKYIFKGTYLRVEGSIKNGKYTNKDGIEVYTSEIICSEIGFLSTKDENEKLATPPNDPPMDGESAPKPQQKPQQNKPQPKPKPVQQSNSQNQSPPDDFGSPPDEFQTTGGDDDIPF